MIERSGLRSCTKHASLGFPVSAEAIPGSWIPSETFGSLHAKSRISFLSEIRDGRRTLLLTAIDLIIDNTDNVKGKFDPFKVFHVDQSGFAHFVYTHWPLSYIGERNALGSADSLNVLTHSCATRSLLNMYEYIEGELWVSGQGVVCRVRTPRNRDTRQILKLVHHLL